METPPALQTAPYNVYTYILRKMYFWDTVGCGYNTVQYSTISALTETDYKSVSNHELHPISRPNTQAMGCILWKLTTPHCFSVSGKTNLNIDLYLSPLQWHHNKRDGVANHRRITEPFAQAQIKENIKAPRHWPLWGTSTGDRWIPRRKSQ